jgi:hypothetical protein
LTRTKSQGIRKVTKNLEIATSDKSQKSIIGNSYLGKSLRNISTSTKSQRSISKSLNLPNEDKKSHQKLQYVGAKMLAKENLVMPALSESDEIVKIGG